MQAVNYFKSLADETRLRILNLLAAHELNVNEIVSVMGMGQSRISRHLKILSDCGFVHARRDGLWVFYSVTDEHENHDLVRHVIDFLRADPEFRHDLDELEQALAIAAQEKKHFFNSIAPKLEAIKDEMTGGIDLAEEIISRIQDCGTAADLGCGTGGLLQRLTERAERVIGVDSSPVMLEEARRRLSGNSAIELRIGELEHLPMRDSEIDAAVINMVLHYVQSPPNAIEEASRVLRSGGSFIAVDFAKHSNETMREKYGHRWLGFPEADMKRMMAAAGLKYTKTESFEIRDDLKVNMFLAVRE